MIYLASPYSHSDKSMMQARFEATERCCALMLQAGLVVFSPIVHCHELAKRHELPHTYEFWLNLDFGILRHCEAMHVLELDGWSESKGVRAELDFCKQARIPVESICESLSPGFWPGDVSLSGC